MLRKEHKVSKTQGVIALNYWPMIFTLIRTNHFNYLVGVAVGVFEKTSNHVVK